MDKENNQKTEPVTQTETEKEQTVDKAEEKEEAKTFTQEEVNSLIKKEKDKISKKYEGVDIEEYKKWKDSQKTDAEKQQEIANELSKKELELASTKHLIAILGKGIKSEDADYVQFKIEHQDGDFNENLEQFLKDNPKYVETDEVKTTGFSQNNANKTVSEEKSYLDKKYANNPYYKQM